MEYYSKSSKFPKGTNEMKKKYRILSLCLLLAVIITSIPFLTRAAINIPSDIKPIVFNAAYYAEKNSDVKKLYGNDEQGLYDHFLAYGIKEGRQASPIFSVSHYLSQNSDLKSAYGTDNEKALTHFINTGSKEARITAPAENLGSNVKVRISVSSTGLNVGYSNTNVQTNTTLLEAAQLWNLVRQGDGGYKITNIATGKLMTVKGGATANGTNVELADDNGSNSQIWYIYKNMNNTYTIRAKCGVKCVLTVKNGSTSSGTNIQMNTFAGGASQEFNIQTESALEAMTPVDIGSNFWGNIQAPSSNYNLALSGDNVLLRYANTGYNQLWRFIRFSDGSYEITNLKNGKSLACDGFPGTPGSNVYVKFSNNTASQRWYIYEVNGNYVLGTRSALSSVMEVTGGTVASGTNIQLASFSSSSAAQQFKVKKIEKTDIEKNLAISEICESPANASYEFIEATNVSNKSINLKEYSLYRFACTNGSGKYQYTGYQAILGLVAGTGTDTSLSFLAKLNLSSYNTVIHPGEVAVLWFVKYADRALTVDDFKNYWESQGCSMDGVNVVRIATYDGTSDLYPASGINTNTGIGFLPDNKVGVAISLIKNSALATRLENGKVLKDYTASSDAPLDVALTAQLHSVADSTAVYIFADGAKTGKSHNFYSFVDTEAYLDTCNEQLEDYMLKYTHVFPTVPYSAQVTGTLSSDGCPSLLGEYINVDSSGNPASIAIGVDSGNLDTPTPGVKRFGQFAGFKLVNAETDTSGNVVLTGSFTEDIYSKAGFIVTAVCADTGKLTVKKTELTSDFTIEGNVYKFTVKIGGLPITDKGTVLNVVPFGIDKETGDRAVSARRQIRCPLVNVTINGTSIEGLRVTYLADEKNAPINDWTGILDAIELLADDIEYYTGIEVETGIYNPRANYPQIVVASEGDTSGGNALVANNKAVGENQYTIVAKTKRELYIVGDSAMAAEYACQIVSRAISGAVGTFELSTLSSDYPETLDTSKHTLAMTDGADYRIMTMNIQDHKFNTALERYDALEEVVKYTNVDVIGFQEYGLEVMNNFTHRLQANGYTVFGNDLSNGLQNRTVIAFKTSRFTCVEKGFFALPGDDNNNNPWYGTNWAVLKDKQTGKTFAVTSSHFFNRGTDEEKLATRILNSEKVVALTKDIQKKHGCEVINFGDFNMRSFDEAYHVMVKDGYLTDSRFDSYRDDFLERIGHVLGTTTSHEGSPSRTIDFLFTTEKVNTLRTRAVRNMQTGIGTDHYPIYVDVAIN